MAYIISPVLGMKLADPTTIQAFVTTDVNADFLALENGIVADRVRLSALETFEGVVNAGVARGTLADYKVATPAALQALANMVAGDTAVMAGDGTNFTQAVFQYTGAKWAAPVVQFTSAAGAMAAFTTYLLLGTNTNLLQTGGTGILNGLVPVQYGANGWQKLGLVRPTANPPTTGGSTIINDDGSLTCTFTGAGTVTPANYFASTNPYDTDDYDVEINGSGSASTYTLKLANAGVVDPATTTYDTFGTSFAQTGVPTAATALATSQWFLSNNVAVVRFDATIELKHPALAVPTTGELRATAVVTANTAKNKLLLSCDNNANTAFDAFQVIVSAACVVNIKVKPRA